MSNEIITRQEINMQAERLAIIENRLRDNRNRVAESLIDIGRCLNQAKEEKLVPHGQWQAWVQEHTGLSVRDAQRAMQVARELPNTTTLSHLDFSKVYALLSVPAEEREAFAEEVGADEMSLKELKAAIKAKEDAERELEKERELREKAEKDFKNREKEERGKEDEVEKLRTKLEEKEEELDRRAEAETKAKQELLALRTQVARGYISNSNGENLSPDELGEITAAFIGRAAILPHMRTHFATCDHNTRGAYRAHVEMIYDWCERAMRALDTIEGEVVEA